MFVYGICTVSRHFVSPKTLLCFRVRVDRVRVSVRIWARVSRNTFSVKRVFKQV